MVEGKRNNNSQLLKSLVHTDSYKSYDQAYRIKVKVVNEKERERRARKARESRRGTPGNSALWALVSMLEKGV